MLVANDSPLRKLPLNLSKKQFLVFDGIRYAAQMAAIAYTRLLKTLVEITRKFHDQNTPISPDITCALLDAWAIVDAVNRMRDLLCSGGHGIKLDTFHELFRRNTEVTDSLRNNIQHIDQEINNLARSSGQLWGYITWAIPSPAEVQPGWYCIVPGSTYVGDRYVTIPADRQSCKHFPCFVKLYGYGQVLDFETVMESVAACVRVLEQRIAHGEVRSLEPVSSDRRVGDMVVEAGLEIAYTVEHSQNE